MKRRELFRLTGMGVLGAALSGVRRPSRLEGSPVAPAREFPPDYDASRLLARPDWRPVFLTDHQTETLAELGEMIIPTTDTPGAREALVHRFLDHLLAAERPEVQQSFLESLFFIDGECRRRYGSAFLHLSTEKRLEYLNLVARPHDHVTWRTVHVPYEGHRHFGRLKDWIRRAYYSSEIGMRELGWEDAHFHEEFRGCPHPSGTHA